MKIKTAAVPAVIAALALTTASCTKPAGDPAVMSAPATPPAALAIVTTQPQADHAGIAALVAGSAQTGEHLEILSGSGKVLSSVVAPPSPVITSPAPPPSLPANPTQFQIDAHQGQEKAFNAKLEADRRTLARSLANRLSGWAVTATDALTQAAGGAGNGPGPQPGISAASSFFTSLQQAGLNLSTRRVLVIFGVSGPPGSMPPLQPGSLSGITVIIADFVGNVRAQQEWQSDLLQAGAARAIVLVPAAAGEVAPVIRQGLAGHAGPAPAVVYFGLNQASLQPAARTVLRQVAAELTTTYPDAVATVLGFADPLGNPARNALLSADRALAVEAFLVDHGVAAARLSAAGYGTDLPAAPSQAGGAQPLDRRAIVVIDSVVA